ncbi:hypothetical protein DSECCO2_441740 [anaerobic digester metagenome]
MGVIGGLTIEQMVVEVNKVKEKWLEKKIQLIDLTKEIEDVIRDFKQEQNYVHLKNYIENVILLDKNVKSSATVIANVMWVLVPIFLSVNASVLTLTDNKHMAIWFAVISLVMSVGLVIVACSILRKNTGKYAREKSFYEILLKII